MLFLAVVLGCNWLYQIKLHLAFLFKEEINHPGETHNIDHRSENLFDNYNEIIFSNMMKARAVLYAMKEAVQAVND